MDSDLQLRLKSELKDILLMRMTQETELFDRVMDLCERNAVHAVVRASARPKALASLLNSNLNLRKAFFEVSSQLNPTKLTTEDYQSDARTAWDEGELDDAVLLYSFAIELDSENGVAWMNRGNVQIELGNFESGVFDLLKARSIDEDLPTLHAEIFEILSPEIRELTRQKMIEGRKLRK